MILVRSPCEARPRIPMAKSSQPKPPTKQWGGRRTSAGRKPTEVTRTSIELDKAVNGIIGDMALDLVANLKRLADGGYQRVTETLEPAAEMMRDALVRDADGNPRFEADGRPMMAKQPLYPNAKPGEMVVTKRVVEVVDGDRAANEYLLNRRFGKPKQAVELSGPDGVAIPVSIEAAIEFIYGELDPD